MKRILHIIGSMNRAGAETMLINLYRVLDRDQYQFDFLYFTDKKCDYDDEIEKLGGKIYRVKSTGSVSRFWETYKFLRSNKQFYAVHTHTLLNNGFNVLGASLAGHQKRISHSHSTSNVSNNSFSSKIYFHLSKYLINTFSTGLIACGYEAGNYLFYKNKQFKYLPNAVNFDDFNHTHKSLRPYFECDENTLLICQIGRFLKVKNHSFSIELAKYMDERNIDFKLIFVGDGVLRETMERKVKEYGLDSKVEFLGLRKDIPRILSSSDCMILPSLHEGFPVVLVESQVAGTPSLISTNVAKEVDLGVGLIQFEFLSSNFNLWVDKLQKISKLKKRDKCHLKVLEDKGFNTKSSLKQLLNYYNDI
ncbi:glycosyltransferase [Chryseobacterium sp. RR2-3-20]|uniref:glycosyltransferase n=1 Tax=Chryseobacterium sp. RR2-3-20 TaxID=2787626 RepID=UPI001ADF20E3|nr:glycosyltransferase [Chryseobacterium sp. RR2-3-20]